MTLGVFVLTANAQNFEWTAQNSGVTTILNDVFFTDNQTGWAIGDGGVIVNTTDGGQTWLSQASGTTEKLRAVFFINTNIGWIAGGLNTKTILKTTNGGSDWQNITPSNISNNQIRDIAFADENTGWALVYDSIYLTTDGGGNWAAEPYASSVLQEGLDHKAIAVTSDTTAYIAGTRKRLSTSSTYADVFNKNPYESPLYFYGAGVERFDTDDKLRCIVFNSYTTGFAAGDKGIIYKFEQEDEANMAGPWNKNFDLSSQENGGIWSISFPNETNGMFNTSIGTTSSTALIYHTADGGDTWSTDPDSIPDLLLGMLHAPDDKNAWIVGSSGAIYKGVPKVTSINTAEALSAIISPNPFIGQIRITLPDNYDNVQITITNLAGQLLNSYYLDHSQKNINILDLETLPAGIYLLNIKSNNTVFETQKLIKQ